MLGYNGVVEFERPSFEEKTIEEWIVDFRSADARTWAPASNGILQLYRLSQEKRRAVLPALLAGIRDADDKARLACAGPLGNMPRDIALSDVLDMWRNTDNLFRSTAARLLVAEHLKSPEALEVLIEALRSPWLCIRESDFERLRWRSVTVSPPRENAARFVVAGS
jgi:hypothetical protein